MYGTNDISLESRVRSQGDAAFERMLDPIEGSPATGKSVAGIINLFVDDLFGTGGTEMEQRVPARLKKRMAKSVQNAGMMCSSQDRIRWMKDPQLGPSVEVSQARAIEELEEIPVKKKTQKKITTVLLHCKQGTEAFWDR